VGDNTAALYRSPVSVIEDCIFSWGSYPFVMNRSTFIAVLVCVPVLLMSSLAANEKETAVKSKKPSLSYYYFDG
jgi:hypothetical protein